LRYCGAECQRDDWPRHRPECRAWRAEADAATIAAGGCPLGDVAAQRAAYEKWRARERTTAEIRAAAAGGNQAAQFMLGMRIAPSNEAQCLFWVQRAAAGNLALAQMELGLCHQKGERG